ncbi:MAG TPA: hypothetical protein DCP28_03685 [Cytophagales bacterium]|nr:hypothetical protein [Cytophagales bacterium]
MGVWVAWQLMMAVTQGVLVSVDTQRYMRMAEGILQGQWPTGWDTLYASYAVYLAFCFWVKGGYTLAVVGQVLASGAAAWAMYDLGKRWSGEDRVGWLAVTLFVGWPKFAEWNFIVYTDALFTYGCVVLLWGLYRLHTWKHGLLWGIGAMVVILFRPMGMAILLGLWAMGLVRLLQRQTNWLPTIGYACLSGIVAFWVLTHYIAPSKYLFQTRLESYRESEIIYPHLNFWVDPPEHFYEPQMGAPKGWGMLFGKNVEHILKLAAIKLGLLFGHMKPYYTWYHNLFIAVYLFPIYLVALRGIWRKRIHRLTYFMLVFIAAQAGVVALTTENWDGRFLLPLLPYLMLLAASGFFPRPLLSQTEIEPAKPA